MADKGTLRETRDDLAVGIAELHRKAGQIPKTREIENFLAPILAKVDQTSDQPLKAPPPPKQPRNRSARAGDWYGEEDHSPQIGVEGKSRVAAPLPGETMRLESKVLGNYAIDGATVKPLDGAPTGARKMTKREEFARWLVSQLMGHPDFKRRFQAVTFGNLQGAAREKAYRRIFADAYRLFGDPGATYHNAPEKKIIVGGK
jgi:hypothetical protein